MTIRLICFSSHPQKMLKFDFKKRITAAESLKHPYFEEYEQYPPVFVDSKSSSSTSTSPLNNPRRNAASKAFPFTNNSTGALKEKVSI